MSTVSLSSLYWFPAILKVKKLPIKFRHQVRYGVRHCYNLNGGNKRFAQPNKQAFITRLVALSRWFKELVTISNVLWQITKYLLHQTLLYGQVNEHEAAAANTFQLRSWACCHHTNSAWMYRTKEYAKSHMCPINTNNVNCTNVPAEINTFFPLQYRKFLFINIQVKGCNYAGRVTLVRFPVTPTFFPL